MCVCEYMTEFCWFRRMHTHAHTHTRTHILICTHPSLMLALLAVSNHPLTNRVSVTKRGEKLWHSRPRQIVYLTTSNWSGEHVQALPWLEHVLLTIWRNTLLTKTCSLDYLTQPANKSMGPSCLTSWRNVLTNCGTVDNFTSCANMLWWFRMVDY